MEISGHDFSRAVSRKKLTGFSPLAPKRTKLPQVCLNKKECPMTDAEFKARLTTYLAQFSEGQKPIIPLFEKADGSIDRNKTLALPCVSGFQLEH